MDVIYILPLCISSEDINSIYLCGTIFNLNITENWCKVELHENGQAPTWTDFLTIGNSPPILEGQSLVTIFCFVIGPLDCIDHFNWICEFYRDLSSSHTTGSHNCNNQVEEQYFWNFLEQKDWRKTTLHQNPLSIVNYTLTVKGVWKKWRHFL